MTQQNWLQKCNSEAKDKTAFNKYLTIKIFLHVPMNLRYLWEQKKMMEVLIEDNNLQGVGWVVGIGDVLIQICLAVHDTLLSCILACEQNDGSLK